MERNRQKTNIRRVFLIVLDSFGIGAMPDAEKYGDAGCNTLASVAASGAFVAPVLTRMGLFAIDGVREWAGKKNAACKVSASYARMAEASAGKDTTTGHWEIAGVVSHEAFPVFPNGFPEEFIRAFEQKTGRKVICNRPYSGTEVIMDFGREQIAQGSLIIYTSADSVFQVAAHEAYIGLGELYRCCGIAREMLQGKMAVARVIARPYTGEYPHFKRTANRHDYSLSPPGDTVCDILCKAGYETIGIGKTSDIFNGKGIGRQIKTVSNADGMQKTLAAAVEDFEGLCFVNLVDFDMLYGHRNDTDGYARAISEFDKMLEAFLKLLRPEDVLMITADHGCDPGAPGTDHTREYVPMLIYGDKVRAGVNIGTRGSFADISATILDMMGILHGSGSFWPLVQKGEK